MPLLALPWWCEMSLRGKVDADFQADLMVSGCYGYLFVRMLDDLMDGHDVDRACIPALHLFSFRFQSMYAKCFPAADAFWQHYERSLAATAEAESADAELREVSADDFLRITSRKSSAALIPLAAVCCRYGRLDLLPAWERFLTLFARWHQMRDDVLDWNEDHQKSQATWLLTEVARRKSGDETVPVWMGRTGLTWAAKLMDEWMVEIQAAARELRSEELLRYLEMRAAVFARQIDAQIKLAAMYESLLRL